MPSILSASGLAPPRRCASHRVRSHPSLGAVVDALRFAAFDRLGLDCGATVSASFPTSLAARVHVQLADIITALDDRPVGSTGRLQRLVQRGGTAQRVNAHPVRAVGGPRPAVAAPRSSPRHADSGPPTQLPGYPAATADLGLAPQVRCPTGCWCHGRPQDQERLRLPRGPLGGGDTGGSGGTVGLNVAISAYRGSGLARARRTPRLPQRGACEQL